MRTVPRKHLYTLPTVRTGNPTDWICIEMQPVCVIPCPYALQVAERTEVARTACSVGVLVIMYTMNTE